MKGWKAIKNEITDIGRYHNRAEGVQMTQVSIVQLKYKALKLPEPVKSLILSELDTIDSTELIFKLGTWDKLLAMEVTQK